MTRRRRMQLGRRLVLLAVVVGGLGQAAASSAAGPPTKAAASAFAGAVNLHAGDVPGFKTGKVAKTTAADRRMGAAIAKCAGGVDPNRAVVDADSPDFTSSSGIVQQDISSDVEILPSAALAAKDIASVKTSHGKACIERGFEQGFKAMKLPGVTFGRESVASMPLQANGADASFALRFTIIATIKGVKIPYYSDFLGFTLGPAEVTLSALGFATPVSNTDELELFSLLLRRAEAASL
jgi:hypothetical protein